jgi:hypothetical protein
VPRSRLRGVHGAVQVDVDQRVVVGHRHLVERPRGRSRGTAAPDARVGERDVDAAVLLDDPVDGRADRGGVAHVKRDAADLVAARGQPVDRALEALGVHVGDDHVGAGVGQDRRERVAQPGRATGDQGHLAADVEQLVNDAHQAVRRFLKNRSRFTFGIVIAATSAAP